MARPKRGSRDKSEAKKPTVKPTVQVAQKRSAPVQPKSAEPVMTNKKNTPTPDPAPSPTPEQECPERVENPNCFGWIEMCDPHAPCDGGEPDPGTGEPMPRGNEHGNHGGGYGCMPYPYPPCYPPYYPPYPPHGHHGHHPRYPMKGNIWMRCECACPPPVQTEDRFHIFPAGVQQEDIQTQASAFIALNPGARFGSLVDLEHDGWLLHYTVPV